MRTDRRDFIRAVGATATIGIGATGVATAQQGPTVEMVTEGGSYYFDPIGLHVEPGTTVTFENVSGSHSSTAYEEGLGPAQTTRIPDGASGWDSGVLTSAGATYQHTFETPGTYDHFCIPHKTLGMIGRLVVGEPGGPAEGSMPPDGAVPESSRIVENGTVSYDAFTSDSGGSESDSSGTAGQPLVGAGLLGGLTVAAGAVYWLGNSEGEGERVGSSEWKQRHGLE